MPGRSAPARLWNQQIESRSSHGVLGTHALGAKWRSPETRICTTRSTTSTPHICSKLEQPVDGHVNLLVMGSPGQMRLGPRGPPRLAHVGHKTPHLHHTYALNLNNPSNGMSTRGRQSKRRRIPHLCLQQGAAKYAARLRLSGHSSNDYVTDKKLQKRMGLMHQHVK